MKRLEVMLNYEGLRFLDENKKEIDAFLNFLDYFEKKDLRKIKNSQKIREYTSLTLAIDKLLSIKEFFEEKVEKIRETEVSFALQKEKDYNLSYGTNMIFLLDYVLKKSKEIKERYETKEYWEK